MKPLTKNLIWVLAIFLSYNLQAQIFTVTNTDDDGIGSLRQAVTDANTYAGAASVEFNIAGAGPWVIALQSGLDAISNSNGVAIDGTTQPGWTFGDANAMVTIDASVGGFTPLVIEAANFELYGMVVTGSSGIAIYQNTPNSGTIIGGAGKGNVISGNDWTALWLNNASNTTIQGNYIGLSVDGLSANGNVGQHVIRIQSNNGVLIGGDQSVGEGNVISGNGNSTAHNAIYVVSSFNVDIYGNYIGTDANGNNNLGNTNGVYIASGSDFNVGGTGTGQGNVISGNGSHGIQIGNATNAKVRNNIIGLNAAGNTAIGNVGEGIYLTSNSSGHEFTDNVISANNFGIRLITLGSSEVVITGNRIGTAADGTAGGGGLGNDFAGISLSNSDGISLANPIYIANNTISGNGESFTYAGISEAGSDYVVIENNFIGVESDGITANGNSGQGISLSTGTNIRIGGSGVENTIAHNGSSGISNSGTSFGTQDINRNSFFCNGTVGIDIIGTPDVSPPVITDISGGTVTGTSVETNGTEIDIYEVDTDCGGDQGMTWLVSTTVTGGNWSVAASYGGDELVATATTVANGTSEFSSPVLPSFIVNNTSDSGPGSLRQAILDANASAAKETITFNIPGSGPWQIDVGNAMVIDNATNQGVIIDGLTQPGSSFGGDMVILNKAAFSAIITISDPNVEIYGIQFVGGRYGIETNASGDNFQIGAAERGNIFQSSQQYGLNISSASGGFIQGNYIGTSLDGLSISGTGSANHGIYLSSADGIQIGGDRSAGEGNLISGNGDSGTEYAINLASSDNISIYGNLIGTDINGENDLGNNRGINVASGCDVVNIGGSGTGQGNVISGNGTFGIVVQSTPTSVTIEYNIIGLNAAGDTAIPNNGTGITATGADGADMVIQFNTISGNSSHGINIDGVQSNTLIQNNNIGTDINGTAGGGGLGNLNHGISFRNSDGTDNTINRIQILNNVISGNGNAINDFGINFTLTNTNFLIQGNNIGVETDGSTAYGNAGSGISLSDATANIEIGGDGNENIIAHNTWSGIFFDNQTQQGSGMVVGPNSYFCNANKAIEFENGPAVGAPVISQVLASTMTGTSASADLSTVHIYEIDPSCADDQGATYIGSASVSSNTWTYSGPLTVSNTYVATVADVTNGISEFSSPFMQMPGPGGVLANLEMWLKADAGTTVATGVSLWEDQSIAGNDVSQATGVDQPALTNPGLNFQPVLTFDGTDYLETSTTGVLGGGNYTKIAVSKVTTNSGFNNVISAQAGGNHAIYYNNGRAFLHHGNDDIQLVDDETDNSILFTATYEGGTPLGQLFIDGALAGTSGAIGSYTDGGFTAIGSYLGANFMEGDIAEAIIFSNDISTNERRRAESYLAAKYGISRITTPIENYLASDGSNMWDQAGFSGYYNDITVIGRDDASGLNQKQSQSSSSDRMVTMGHGEIAIDNQSNSNDFNSDLSFLSWANNNGDASSFGTTVSGLNGVSFRVTRLWKIDKQGGDIDNLTVQFDLTNSSPPSSFATDYKLIIDDDGVDWSNATVVDADSYSSNVAEFSGVSFSDGNFFTIALRDLAQVVSTNDAGGGSLRQAIIDANAGSGGTITFNIPGTGPWTISLASDLPNITQSMTIDGTTQTGWDFSTENMVAIDMTGYSNGDGFSVLSANVDITGMKIVGGDFGIVVNGEAYDNSTFSQNIFQQTITRAINIINADNITIQGNHIGVSGDGLTNQATSGGAIAASSSDNLTIGGDRSIGEGNMIAGSAFSSYLISVSNPSTTLTIQGNVLGASLDGSDITTSRGIYINNVDDITLGGANANLRNYICGINDISGVTISNADMVNIQNNYFGVGVNDSHLIGNGANPIDAISFTTVTNFSIDANVISGSNSDGIYIFGSSDAGTITNNLIGLAPDGSTGFGNSNYGIQVAGSSLGTIAIGGSGNENSIAYNNVGVRTSQTSFGSVDVQENRLFCNTTAGIDISGTPLVTAPTITDVLAQSTSITGTTVGAADTWEVHVYSTNGDCADNQGYEYVGMTTPTSNVWSLTAPFNSTSLVAVLYDPTNGISEFSNAFAVPDLVVTSAADDNGAGLTLREAVVLANTNAGSDDIVFDPSLTGSTITLSEILGTLTLSSGNGDETTIDGDIDGDGIPDITLVPNQTSLSGVTINAANCEIRGLNFQGFASAPNAAISITGATATGNRILANFIGTDITGQSAGTANFRGVGILSSASGNFIGDGTLAGQNVISNNSFGVYINGADNNVVSGNIIGLDLDGDTDLGNLGAGVEIITGVGNQIGVSGELVNVISGNGGEGISLSSSSTGNFIVNNYIGVESDGSTAIGNDAEGILIDDTGSSNNSIGDGTPGGQNVISGNQMGIEVSGTDAIILGNHIGLNASGSGSRPNTSHGIWVTTGATNVQIGNGTEDGRNLIGGNGGSGILISEGPTEVYGNWIGTSSSGALDRGNGVAGITVAGGSGNKIGDAIAGYGNVMAGNPVGLAISASDVEVYANYIGLNGGGYNALANDNEGIRLTGTASNVQIGNGTVEGANYIAGNGADGILLSGASVTGNTIDFNYFGMETDLISPAANGANSILIESGANTNVITSNVITNSTTNGIQVNGLSGGANQNTFSQNSIFNNTLDAISIINSAQDDILVPIITNMDPSTLEITGDAGAGTQTIELFFDAVDESQQYLGSTTSTAGSWSYTVDIGDIPNGLEFLTATATDVSGNTSALSAPLSSAFNQYVVVNTNDEEAGSLRWCIENANVSDDTNTITFNIPDTDPNYDNSGGYETWTISPVTQLTTITETVIIDATTQPGAGTFNIILDGQGTIDDGLDIEASDSEVYGLYITSFASIGLELGNPGSGFIIGAANKGNTIVDNTTGIHFITGSNSVVQGNYIGTDEMGNLGLGNSNQGIQHTGVTSTIGGLNPGEGNVISGNRVGIQTNVSNDIDILGNYVGTDPTGSFAIPNTNNGITLGTFNGAEVIDNVISGNGDSGLSFIQHSNITIQGNHIGVGADGTTPLGNGEHGIHASASNIDNMLIGGLGAGEPNIIAYNTESGINFWGSDVDNNQAIANQIFCNGEGISLGSDANENKTAPIITTITATDVSGTSGLFDVIHVYRDNTSCLPLQGAEYLGTTTADDAGLWNLTGLSISVGTDLINATATDASGNTSEFAADYPDIAVFVGSDNTGVEILDGQENEVYSGLEQTGSDLDQVFTIDNLNIPDLNISSIDVTGSDFSVVSPPSGVEWQSSENFTLRLSGSTPGVYRATVTINSDDDDEPAFAFNVIGEISDDPISGKPGNALDFDGTNDYVHVGNPDALDIDGDISLEFWVNWAGNTTGNDQTIIGRSTSGDTEATNVLYMISVLTTGELEFFFEYGSGSDAVFTTTELLPSGEWVHVAATRDATGQELNIYLDGQALTIQEGTSYVNNATGGTSGTQRVRIGSGISATTDFDGQLDEIRIWDDVRTQTELQDNRYNLLNGDEANLLAYYRFDHGTAGATNTNMDLAVDLAGGFTGELTNFSLDGDESNWVASDGIAPEASEILSAYGVTTTGFDVGFSVPSGATDILVDVADNPDFSAPLVSGQSLGTTSPATVNVALSAGNTYYYRLQADHSGDLSNPRVSNGFMIKPGNALDFDGSGDYVQFSSAPLSAYTIEGWFNFSSISAQTLIKSTNSGNPVANVSQHIRLNGSGNLEHNTFAGGDVTVTGTTTVNTDEWIHVAITAANSGFARLYVNGVEEGTALPVGTLDASADEFRLGFNSTGTNFFDGRMDEVRIWNVVRDQADIENNLYNTLSGSESGLVAYYRFDQGQANGANSGISTAIDETANNNDGTLNGFALTGSSSNWVQSEAMADPLVVINTNDSGIGSLRNALAAATASTSLETVSFNIPGAGPWNITLTTEIPNIDNPNDPGLVIDGTTQPGWIFGDPDAMIILTGPGNGQGLDINDPDVEIYGLAIDNFSTGISVNSGADRIIIGAPGKGNVIGGSTFQGISVYDSDAGVIQGNYVGLSIDGLSTNPNLSDGILLNATTNFMVGGDQTAGEGNIISGNGDFGSEFGVDNFYSTGTRIYGNWFGTDRNGENDLGNNRGVNNEGCDDTLIGGSGTGQRNVISGSDSNFGLYVYSSSNWTVEYNYFGLNSAGTSVIPSTDAGIMIFSDGLGGIVRNNVIAGHTESGIYLESFTSDLLVENNFIGTNPSGVAVAGFGNLDHGIEVSWSSGIDNSTQQLRILNNVIAGNGNTLTDNGIDIVGTCENTLIQGNLIGVEADGTTAAGNAGHGISFDDESTNLTIGGSGEENTIANNGGNGIFFANQGQTSTGVIIDINSYYCNGSEALKFENTPIVDIPLITGITPTSVSGTTGIFETIHVYRDNDCLPAQGKEFLGTTTADDAGLWTVSGLTIDEVNDVITATTTHPTDGISEFYRGLFGGVEADDYNALAALYNDTGGASWTDNTGWLSGNVTDWYGVTVSANRVTEINLSSNNLVGTIPTEVQDLSELAVLNLNENQLSGSIPTELGSLTALTFLDIDNNLFTGSIPAVLGDLTSLQQLFIGDNQLTGSLPPELANITGLIDLDGANNQLSGSIPDEYVAFVNLTEFDFDDNMLSGSIPTWIDSWVNMQWLDLDDNALTGTIPVEIGNLPSIETLKLGGNQLTGSIPSELGNLTTLDGNLGLEQNQLTGSIPPELGNLVNLNEINLYANQLTGSIPTEIGNMASLEYLNFNNCDLSGSIPSSLGNLTLLIELILNNNSLTGTIPPELGSLSNVTYFDLHNNNLTGSIPIELGNLSSVDLIQLYGNQLSGSIPTELGNLTTLTILQLHQNQLTGDVPTEFQNLTLLEDLRLRTNDLDNLPDLTALTGLTNFPVYENNFEFDDIEPNVGIAGIDYDPQADITGPADQVLDVGDDLDITISVGGANNSYQWYQDGSPVSGQNSDNLFISNIDASVIGTYYLEITNSLATDLTLTSQTFDVSLNLQGGVAQSDYDALVALYNDTDGANWTNNTNWLSGDVSSWHGITVSGNRVTEIQLGINSLAGTIPTELGNLTNLEELRLGENSLTGEIPSQIGNLINLTYLELDRNQLTGSIPTELGNLTNLNYLEIHVNFLTGSIPTELGGLTNLIELQLDRNQLTGSIPTELGDLVNLEQLHTYDNQLSGSIPVELGSLVNLTDLELDQNQLTGAIPSEIGGLINLVDLDLHSNLLSGSIPIELGNLINLTDLDLQDNQLTGTIPTELGNLSSLENLYFDDNQLSGSIPTELGNLTNLIDLNIEDNLLTGAIPATFGNLVNLDYLDLQNNQLTGSIPPELGNLINLTEIDLQFNQLSGSIPVEIGDMTSLENLKFDDNLLTGSIPDELGSLINLIDLNIEDNQLSGSIPATFGNLANLDYLDLENNQLSGSIPTELGNLVNLTELDLRTNQLSGSVPSEFTNLSNMVDLKFPSNQLTDLPDLSVLSNLTNLEIEGNNFEFDDIEPNVGIGGIVYSPQADLPGPGDLVLNEGDDLDETIAVGGSNNVYQWYLDGSPVSGQTSDNLLISPVTLADAGTYHLEVTNTLATSLTLSSESFTVTVNPALEPEIEVFVGADNMGTPLTAGQLTEVDFGSSEQATDLSVTFAIENTGDADLNIGSITSSELEFTISGAPSIIGIGVTETFDIILTGATIGSFNADITVNSDDSDEGAFTFPVTGEIVSQDLPVVANATDTEICEGEEITLTGSGADTYSWDNGVTDGVAFVPTATTTYTVTGTDGDGNMGTDQITITVHALPTVTATTTDSEICEGEEITLTGTGADTYAWDHGVTDGVSFSPASTETYTVTGTDANGCTNTDQLTVTVSTLPTVIANATATEICLGEEVTLTGSGADTYTWDNEVTDGESFMPAQTMTYTVIGTGGVGCSNTDQIEIVVNPLPTVTASVSDAEICLGDEVVFTGGGAASYSWDNAVIDNVAFSPSGTATFTVTGTDINGCIATAQIDVTVNVVDQPTIEIVSDNGRQIVLSSSAASAYQWYESGEIMDGETGQTIQVERTYTFGGDYQVEVTEGECSNISDTEALRILNADELSTKLEIWPNPVYNVLNVKLSQEAVGKEIKIYDLTGSVVDTRTLNHFKEFELDLSTLGSGVYFLAIEDLGEMIRFVKN